MAASLVLRRGSAAESEVCSLPGSPGSLMTHERCPEEDAEAILSNLKMEGRGSATPCNLKSTFTHCRCPSRGYTVEAWS